MRALVFTAMIAACTPYDPTLPATPFLCGAMDPKCPDGFTCSGTDGMNRPTCVSSSGGGGNIDSSTTGFQCADDSAIEGSNRNDDISHAWMTPIDMGKTTFPLAGLAICPATDKDTYEVAITSEQDLTALVLYQDGGAALSVTILNSTGLSIAGSMPAGTDMVMASAKNLPVASGPYYVQVAGNGTGENNYKVTFTVTPGS